MNTRFFNKITFEQFKLFSRAKGYKTLIIPNGKQAFRITSAGKYFGRYYALSAEKALGLAYVDFSKKEYK